MNYFAIILLTIIVEGIVTYIKELVVNKKVQWQMLVALLLGVFVSIAYQGDLIAMLGLTSEIPLVGNILTGILISRGSNYVFDFVKLVNERIGKGKL